MSTDPWHMPSGVVVECPTCSARSEPGNNSLMHERGCDNTLPLIWHEPDPDSPVDPSS